MAVKGHSVPVQAVITIEQFLASGMGLFSVTCVSVLRHPS